MRTDNPSSANQSTEKAFAIIEFLASRGEPTRLQDIAKKLDIHQSTVSRFLNSLINCGYVSQESDSSKYYLTYRICSIANQITGKIGIREIAGPYIKELSKKLCETVCLAVEQLLSVVYIDVVEGSDQMIRTMQRIGNAAPMHCTGVGKLFLTEYTSEQLRGYIEKRGLTVFTQNTIKSESALREEIAKIKLLGFATDNEECETGAKCIAVPVRDYSSKIVAAISITGPIFRLTDEAMHSYLDKLMATAASVSKKLGYTS